VDKPVVAEATTARAHTLAITSLVASYPGRGKHMSRRPPEPTDTAMRTDSTEQEGMVLCFAEQHPHPSPLCSSASGRHHSDSHARRAAASAWMFWYDVQTSWNALDVANGVRVSMVRSLCSRNCFQSWSEIPGTTMVRNGDAIAIQRLCDVWGELWLSARRVLVRRVSHHGKAWRDLGEARDRRTGDPVLHVMDVQLQ
jgi:hypothetical protein